MQKNLYNITQMFIIPFYTPVTLIRILDGINSTT